MSRKTLSKIRFPCTEAQECGDVISCLFFMIKMFVFLSLVKIKMHNEVKPYISKLNYDPFLLRFVSDQYLLFVLVGS